MAKMDKGVLTGKPVTYPIPSPAGGVQMETFIPWTLVKRGIRREIITPLDAPQAFTVEAAAERTKRNAAQNTPLIRALVHVVALESVACRAVDQHRLRSRRLEAAADHCRARRPALVAYHAHHLARPR